MAGVHAHAARAAGAELVAVATTSLERARSAAERLGAARAAFADDILAASDVDIVHICSPNSTHARMTLAALAAGKHVVCEKPIATTMDDAVSIARAADEAGRIVAVPFVYRFHPLVRETRARLEGAKITTFQGAYLQDWLLEDKDWNWRVDAGQGGRSRAFADIGSHLVDLLEFVTGQRIVELVGHTSRLHDERGGRLVETEDAVSAVAGLDGGGMGTLLVSQVSPGRKNGLVIEISTDEITYRFEQEHPEQMWLGRRTDSIVLPRDPAQLSSDAARLSVVPAGHPQGYQDAFNAFVCDAYASMRGDLRSGLPIAADGVRAVQLTQAVMDSADQHSWIDTKFSKGSRRV